MEGSYSQPSDIENPCIVPLLQFELALIIQFILLGIRLHQVKFRSDHVR